MNQKVIFKLRRENPSEEHSSIILESSYNGSTFSNVKTYKKIDDNEHGNHVSYAMASSIQMALQSRYDYGNANVKLTLCDDLTGCSVEEITIKI